MEEQFPEYPLLRTYKLAFEWTPDGLTALLDAGCAWGYGTRFFTRKARDVYGIDPSGKAIELARRRYPHIRFERAPLEHTPLPAATFDAIICCETLEHVEDEIECFNEMHRLLAPGGVIVLTVPHRGALSFMDPDNYATALLTWAKRRSPKLLNAYRRRFSPLRHAPGEVEDLAPAERQHHRHYTLDDMRRLLDRSAFGDQYELVTAFRSGFLLEMLVLNIHFFLRRVAAGRIFATWERLAAVLIALDYRIPYRGLSNNLALLLVKR